MVDQQHIQVAQTELYMLACIKKWVNTQACFRILVEQARFMAVYAFLLAIF